MKKRLLPALILIAYAAFLIKVLVFKDIPTIRFGGMMFRLGGTESGRPANFVPFKTILWYLLGRNGLLIGGINIVGNIVLLVPVGLLLPFVIRDLTWKKSLAIATASGLALEILQAAFRVGIFDIDDVILNGLGVMIGYWVFALIRGHGRASMPSS